MASFDSTKKLQIYEIIYRLNASFADIVHHCRLLKKFRVLNPEYAHLYQSFAQELQAEINQDVMSIMEDIESDDSFRYGKVRQAWEKENTDPNDVFFRAGERQKEIAQQREGKRRQKKTRNVSPKQR